MVAGGMESMSNAPYYLFGHRTGVKFGDAGAGGRADPRRPLVRVRTVPHGWTRRVHRRQGGHQPRGGRRASPTSRTRRRSRRRTRDGSRPRWSRSISARTEGDHHHSGRRVAAPRHVHGGAGQAPAGLHGRHARTHHRAGGDGGQRARPERWRRRAGGHERGVRPAPTGWRSWPGSTPTRAAQSRLRSSSSHPCGPFAGSWRRRARPLATTT